MKALLQPVLGYLELGMVLDARHEIEMLPAEFRGRKEVRSLLSALRPDEDGWFPMRELAEILVVHRPYELQNWLWLAHATRRCRSIGEAERVLLDARRLHPFDPMLYLNLACYAALSGRINAARRRLSKAILLEPDVRLMAREDPELEVFWPALETGEL